MRRRVAYLERANHSSTSGPLLGDHQRIDDRAHTELDPECGCRARLWLLAAPFRLPPAPCPRSMSDRSMSARLRAHATDAWPAPPIAILASSTVSPLHPERHCRRSERKGIGLAIPYFVVGRRATQRCRRHANANDQVARRKHCFNVGRAARLAMKVFERYRSLTIGTEHVDTCIEGDESDRQGRRDRRRCTPRCRRAGHGRD